MKIEYAGITFNALTPDANGCYWYVTEFEGWGGADVRTVTVEPTSQDGVIVALSLLSSRAIGMKVLCKAPNETKFWAAWNQLLDATDQNLYTPIDFIVHEGPVTKKKVSVVRAQETRMKIVGVGAFEADLSLMAPNPAKTTV